MINNILKITSILNWEKVVKSAYPWESKLLLNAECVAISSHTRVVNACAYAFGGVVAQALYTFRITLLDFLDPPLLATSPFIS